MAEQKLAFTNPEKLFEEWVDKVNDVDEYLTRYSIKQAFLAGYKAGKEEML